MQKFYFPLFILGIVAISACTTPGGGNLTNTIPIGAQAKCSDSAITVTNVVGDIQGATNNVMITVRYTSGTADLYDFSFTVQDKFGTFGTAQSTVYTKSNPFKTGSTYTFPVTLTQRVRTDRLAFTKARAMCFDTAERVVETELRY